jgi:hypothetical protein
MRFPVYVMLIFCPTGILGQSSTGTPANTIPAPAILFDLRTNERTENYTIRCTTGTSGEIITSRLIYEGLFLSNAERIGS